ncbi:MAG TPA: hypothetical protein VIM65_20625 [Cyclobacteriaceae bacterium]
MICGICGSNKQMSFEVNQAVDDDECPYWDVSVSCSNCSSTTGLDEIIKYKHSDE